MPLRDHFRPPVDLGSPWEAVYGGWPMVIVQHMNRVLPDGYAAGPRVHRSGRIDAGTATREPANRADGAGPPWAVPEPTVTFQTALADVDEHEVRVYDNRRQRLVATVELVSPGNLDRTDARAQFVSKCLGLLRQRVSVVIVDVVTDRWFSLYDELLDWVGGHDPALDDCPPTPYAAACRWRPCQAAMYLDAWGRPLPVGQPLPILPLWLTEDLAVPLHLEASYEQTCRDLRIR